MSRAAMNSQRGSPRLSPRLALLTLVSGLALGAATAAQAAVTITPATDGTNVPADRAQNGAVPAYTTLGNILIQEGANGDFANGNNRTLILTAPSGWQFNAGVGSATGSKISGSGGNEVTVNSIAVTAATITVNYSGSGTGQINRLTIGGIQVRATEGGNLAASVSILRTAANPGTASIRTSGWNDCGLQAGIGDFRSSFSHRRFKTATGPLAAMHRSTVNGLVGRI